MNNKIGSTHLSRQAYVYLRQSTAYQVESNRESTQRQYALADRALFLGWDKTQIQILDKDLGKSGQTTSGGEDFHQLMAAVSLGEVGAVLADYASRLSRSQADWHKLLDICALTDTLVIDHDGIYNPNDFNDRVLLGFKGTWSHTELHGMRLRLQGVKTQQLPESEWKVVIHDAHPAYLSWLEYQQNQEQLKRNYGMIMPSVWFSSATRFSHLWQVRSSYESSLLWRQWSQSLL